MLQKFVRSKLKNLRPEKVVIQHHLLFFIAIISVQVLTSCSSIGSKDHAPAYTYSVLSSNSQDIGNSTTIPWNENAIQAAVQSRSIRFYFMSGEKQTFSTSAGIKFGDSCLVAFPNGETMLIDGGMPLYAATLVENLRLLGIEKIDHLVLSHMHDDHYGALLDPNGILANYEIGMLYYNGIYNEKTSVADRFNEAVTRYTINTQILSRGDQFSIGDVHLEVYHPTAEKIGDYYGETALNNTSLVIKFTYKNFSALFAGDLYTDGEYEVLADSGALLDVDLVKANHHGRSTSNSKDWIQATTPRIVVATSGNPIDETPYAYYARIGAYVFNDNLDGYIRVVSDGYSCSTTTSRERATTYYDKYDLIAQSIHPAVFKVIQEDTSK